MRLDEIFIYINKLLLPIYTNIYILLILIIERSIKINCGYKSKFIKC